jgi:hypothetical protein
MAEDKCRLAAFELGACELFTAAVGDPHPPTRACVARAIAALAGFPPAREEFVRLECDSAIENAMSLQGGDRKALDTALEMVTFLP